MSMPEVYLLSSLWYLHFLGKTLYIPAQGRSRHFAAAETEFGPCGHDPHCATGGMKFSISLENFNPDLQNSHRK